MQLAIGRSPMIRIEYSDESCIVGGRSRPGIPVLIGDKGFIKPASDYLCYRHVQETVRASSIKTYAEDLQSFFGFLAKQGVDYSAVTDRILLAWRDWQTTSDAVKNRRLDTVTGLYVWLERRGYISGAIRLPWAEDRTGQLYPIETVRQNRRYHKGKNVAPSAHSPLLIKTPRRRSLPHTPNDDELTKVFAAVGDANFEVSLRNQLLLLWYRSTGVRRKEWQSLTLDQIPSWDQIYELEKARDVAEILITNTKNGRPRYIGAEPSLLESTQEYIEGPRLQIVQRFSKFSGYREPREIFLSAKTGQVIGLTAISNLVKGWMNVAEVRAWGHRIRATFATELAMTLIHEAEEALMMSRQPRGNIDFDLILLKLAERLGHRSISSVRPYLDLARKRIARRQRYHSHAFDVAQTKF